MDMRSKRGKAISVVTTATLVASLGVPSVAMADGESADAGVAISEERGADVVDQNLSDEAAQGQAAMEASNLAALSATLQDDVDASSDVFKGSGTQVDPYLISSAEDLLVLAEKVNASEQGYASAFYKLTQSVDLDGLAWKPIGTKDNPFKGTFIGTGCTISNLSIEAPDSDYVGLFGCISNPAKLQGITVRDVNVTGRACVGSIAGSAYTGSVSDCSAVGVVIVEGNYKVGGMFGEGYATLSNCSIKCEPGGSVRGIYSAPDFEGDNVGGIIGFHGEGAIAMTGCSVERVVVSGTRKVGGIVGTMFTDNSMIECSVSRTEVHCNASHEYAMGSSVMNQLAFGGLVGMFVKNGSEKGVLQKCAVDHVTFLVEDFYLSHETWPVMGAGLPCRW